MTKHLMWDAFPEIQISIKQAQELVEQDDLIIAEAIYRDLLEREQNCPAALYGLAELADKINDQELKKELLQTAIEQIEDAGDQNKNRLKAMWIEELAAIVN